MAKVSKDSIIKSIKNRVYRHTPKSKFKFPYRKWYIGITSDEDKRFSAHGKPELWKIWETYNPDIAKDIEKIFQASPYFMKGNTGGVTNPTHVYTYRDYKPRKTKVDPKKIIKS